MGGANVIKGILFEITLDFVHIGISLLNRVDEYHRTTDDIGCD